MRNPLVTVLLGVMTLSLPFTAGCFGCGAGNNDPGWYGGPQKGTPIHVGISGGAAIDGMLTGDAVQLSAAPTSFGAPLHVTAVFRAGNAIHSRADLAAACAVPLAPGETPSFSGDFLFNPLDYSSVEKAILAGDVAKSQNLTEVSISNLPEIRSATTDEPSLAAAVKQAMTSSAQNAPFTSSNWQLLCDSLDIHPNVRILLSGDFGGQDWEAETRLDEVVLDLD